MGFWKLSQKGSRQQRFGGEAAQDQAQASQNSLRLKYDPSNLEDVLGRFPQRHSCEYCQNDIINALSPASEHEVPAIFLRNGPEAVEAAKNGCNFYRWLLYFFRRSQSPTHHGFYLKRTPLRLKDPRDISSVQFLIGTANYKWPCATFEVSTDSENPAASYISSRPFNADVSSPEAFDVVKGWLKECCTSHTECQPPIDGFFPTRLLDVGDSNGKLVKVVSNFKNVLGSEAAYATLSYCWGDDQAVKTTKETLTQHQISIKTSDLAQTLRDAVKVVRSLCLRFLWVDSLCIIQDDPQDIAREISRMSAYYENGHLSICASVAAGSDQGFLERRKSNPYSYGPFELPYRGPNGRLGSLQLVQYRDYSKEMDPVTSRAWIMQESLLAPRMLSYSYQNVAWSCRRYNRSDGGPSREWHNFEDRKLWARLQNANDLEVYLRKWNRLVVSYTSRSLSDPDDRLPAMSGIVQKYIYLLRKQFPADFESSLYRLEGKDVACADYVAGMWYVKLSSKTAPVMFCQQLLWGTSYYETHDMYQLSVSNSRPAGAVRTPTLAELRNSVVPSSGTMIPQNQGSPALRNLQGPSWSWTSVEEPVHYGREFGDFTPPPNFAVISCETQLETPIAPFGKVLSGRLTVQGSLMPILHAFLGPLRRWVLSVRPDNEERASVLLKIINREMSGWVLPLIDENAAISSKPSQTNWSDSAAKGLILVSDGEYYRRVGICSFEREVGYTPFIGTSGMKSLQSYGEKKTIVII